MAKRYPQMSWNPKPFRVQGFHTKTVTTDNVPWGTYTVEYMGNNKFRAVFTRYGVPVLLSNPVSRRRAYDAVRKHHHRTFDQLLLADQVSHGDSLAMP